MRHLPFLVFVLLTGCTLALPGSGTTVEGPGALAAEEIDVTPLAPPGGNPPATNGASVGPVTEPGTSPGVDGEADQNPQSPDAKTPQDNETQNSVPTEEAAPENEATAVEATVPAAVLSPEATACQRRSGTWGKTPSGGSVCILPTRDAGKSCTRESQCEGLCLARSGTCAPITPVFGCNDILQDDGRRVTLCLD